MRLLCLWVAAALLSLGAAAPSRAEIYRWVDRSGNTRFSDRIEDVPPEWRKNVEEQIRANAGDDPAPAPAAQKPAPPAARPALPAAIAPAPAKAQVQPAHGPLAARLPWLAGFGVAALLAIFVGVFLASFLLWGWLLQLATRLCGEETPSFPRALGILVVQALVGIGIGLTEFLLLGAAGVGTSGPAIQGMQGLIGFGANAVVLARMQQLGLGKAAAIELVLIAISVGIGIAIALAIGMAAGGFGLLHAKG
jgi:hypothetical protein